MFAALPQHTYAYGDSPVIYTHAVALTEKSSQSIFARALFWVHESFTLDNGLFITKSGRKSGYSS